MKCRILARYGRREALVNRASNQCTRGEGGGLATGVPVDGWMIKSVVFLQSVTKVFQEIGGRKVAAEESL